MSVKDVEKRIGKAAFAANIAANKAIKFVLDAYVVKLLLMGVLCDTFLTNFRRGVINYGK